MPAPKGNRFWEARSSHGRKPIFASHEQLEAACLEYFEWVENNPLKETKAFCHQGEVTIAELPKMRAMTLDGLCLFLDIDTNTWRLYAQREDFIQVTRAIETAIRQQKFTGAAADLLNSNIIARDLGLADKSELTGKDGSALVPPDVSSRDCARAVLDLLRTAQLQDLDKTE
jgi:hypothetical protein